MRPERPQTIENSSDGTIDPTSDECWDSTTKQTLCRERPKDAASFSRKLESNRDSLTVPSAKLFGFN